MYSLHTWGLLTCSPWIGGSVVFFGPVTVACIAWNHSSCLPSWALSGSFFILSQREHFKMNLIVSLPFVKSFHAFPVPTGWSPNVLLWIATMTQTCSPCQFYLRLLCMVCVCVCKCTCLCVGLCTHSHSVSCHPTLKSVCKILACTLSWHCHQTCFCFLT